MEVPFRFSLIRFFLACSMAFLMAMGTSRALPMPKPACPWLSPTTTRAEKLRFLPPFTTLVTRLMAMTSSFNSERLTSSSRRTAKLSRNSCFDIGLKLQPRFPRRVSERLHTAVVLVTAAVKHYFLHSSGFSALGHCFADHFCRRDVAATLEILFRFSVDGTRRHQRLAAAIVNHLGVNMSQRTVHAKARAFGGAGNFGAHPIVHALAMQVPR